MKTGSHSNEPYDINPSFITAVDISDSVHIPRYGITHTKYIVT
jgi:hypothetical protein